MNLVNKNEKKNNKKEMKTSTIKIKKHKQKTSKKKIVGLVEIVELIGKKGRVKRKALLDTGATKTSVDIQLAAKTGIGPIIASMKIKNASSVTGYMRRPVAEAKLKIKGITIKTGVNVVDRSDLPYPILIGRDIIHKNFIVDISRTHSSHRVKDLINKKGDSK
ncbi:MAG: RimK/LysX family protein [Candidatus ainarchaeum sp.]|nr:RimK/LysX family protein [Candidatus ainarchaeum sp.]